MTWGQPTGVMADVARLVMPIVQSCGLEFWGCEWAQEQSNRILRIYIDADCGISLEDCVEVSRQLSPLLDVEDIVPGEYNLEVSSPGMARPLFSLAQCQKYCGEEVRLDLKRPIGQVKKKMRGVLKAVENECLVIFAREEIHHVPAEAVHKITLWPF